MLLLGNGIKFEYWTLHITLIRVSEAFKKQNFFPSVMAALSWRNHLNFHQKLERCDKYLRKCAPVSKFQVICNFPNNDRLLEICFNRFANRNHLAGFGISEILMTGHTFILRTWHLHVQSQCSETSEKIVFSGVVTLTLNK